MEQFAKEVMPELAARAPEREVPKRECYAEIIERLQNFPNFDRVPRGHHYAASQHQRPNSAPLALKLAVPANPVIEPARFTDPER